MLKFIHITLRTLETQNNFQSFNKENQLERIMKVLNQTVTRETEYLSYLWVFVSKYE